MDNSLNGGEYFKPPVIDGGKKTKKTLSLDKKDGIFALLIFGCVFVFIDFAVMYGFNLGFTVAFCAVFAVFTAYLAKRDVRPSVFSCLCGLLSLAGSATFTFSRNIFMNCIMLFLVTALFTIYIFGISGTFRHGEGGARMIGDILYGVFVSPFENLPSTARGINAAAFKSKNALYIIFGIALSVPALFVIIPLLVSGDAAFRGLVQMIGKNLGEYILVLILSLVFAPFAVAYAVVRKKNLDAGKSNAAVLKNRRFFPAAAAISFLCVISVTYLFYLFSQLAYFFSAFSGLLPEGYEHSASVYAREGFFEMFAICVINVLIISAVNVFCKTEKGRGLPAFLKGVECFILLFTVLILITAVSKMKLNIETYGLSLYRLLVALFMVMLFVILAFFILHIFAPKISYMQPVILICSVLFIALALADADSIVVRYNIDAYKNGRLEQIDFAYFANGLSESAVPYVAKLAQDDGEIADDALNFIIYKMRNDPDISLDFDGVTLVSKRKRDFRQFNFTVYSAEKSICDYYNSLSQDTKSKIYNYIAENESDAKYGREIGIEILIDSGNVRSMEFDYSIDGKTVCSGGCSPADESLSFKYGETVYCQVPMDSFVYPEIPENGIFGISATVFTKNGEEVPIETLCEWNAKFGESYRFTLHEYAENKFELTPEFDLSGDYTKAEQQV